MSLYHFSREILNLTMNLHVLGNSKFTDDSLDSNETAENQSHLPALSLHRLRIYKN